MLNQMILGFYENKRIGRVDVVCSDISRLFDKHEGTYASVFGLSSEKLAIARRYKISNGGFLVELVAESQVLGFFTFGRITEKHLELGDVIKIRHRLLRQDYAEGLRLASDYFHKREEIIIGYPNERAIKMEMLAGYKIIKNYYRSISFVLAGLTIRLPLKVISRKLIFNFEEWWCQDLINFCCEYHGTAHKVCGLTVMTKAGFRKRASQPIVGFLYEYVEDHGEGDPFICYQGWTLTDTPFGLEYSDNSA